MIFLVVLCYSIKVKRMNNILVDISPYNTHQSFFETTPKKSIFKEIDYDVYPYVFTQVYGSGTLIKTYETCQIIIHYYRTILGNFSYETKN